MASVHTTSAADVYIAAMTGEDAESKFPAIKGLPKGMPVFVVVSEHGDPLLVTDTHAEAVRQVGRHKSYVLRSCH
jgi:hypothetical protein